jgi:hypothetical protein
LIEYYLLDDHDYQVQYEDEDDDERTIDEEEQSNTDDEQNELAHLQAVKLVLIKIEFLFSNHFLLGC